jgi:hypothetical protein
MVALVVVVIGYGYSAGQGWFGVRQTAGEIVRSSRDPEQVLEHRSHQEAARETVGVRADKQIVFGDLHVHTTYSFDAFSISLPMYQGEGAHPPADACDFARFCSGLDFWSINDHAEGLTPQQWSETKETVRQCNDVAGDPASPDLVTFLGWEWTQIGTTPDDHYGHKNVVLLGTAEDEVPARPISSRQQLFPGGRNPYNAWMRLFLIASAAGGQGRQPYHDFARFLEDREQVPTCEVGVDVRELPSNCQESAATPRELFARMDAWAFPYFVIPHGNTWGFYTPPGTTWDKQLREHRDPDEHEYLIEVFSGHGNIEEYRPWRSVEMDGGSNEVCPEPTPGFMAECWRAGEIIATRCAATGESEEECAARAAEARRNHLAAGHAGHLTVPGSEVEDWLDAGQCRDCYMPAYNHRPGGSVQYALALRDFSGAGGDDGEGDPKRFRFGLIGSSDVHTARPGTGYKEVQRRRMTDAGLGNLGPPRELFAQEPGPHSVPIEEVGIASPYFERFASFFGAGGLVAAHSEGRDRQSIWNALERKEVYATSGDRILLWFDLVEANTGDGDAGASLRVPMGSSVVRQEPPSFEVRAVGAFEQEPGCPPDSMDKLGAARLERLCGGECYHPSDQRKRIDRIEVVRIRPQQYAGEPIEGLVEDPWRVLPCPETREGCTVRFSDPDFASAARDAVYYVRAIESASQTMNGAQLRCVEDEAGRCIEVRPCRASEPTAYDDDCTAPAEERAWSSPIFVDYGAAT